jgi:hypothetical protein
LGRQPTEDEQVAAAALLLQTRGIGLLLDVLVRSDDVWLRQLRARASRIVQDISLGLAKSVFFESEIGSEAINAFALTGDFRILVANLQESTILKEARFEQLSAAIVEQLYKGLAHRNPTESESQDAAETLVSIDALHVLAGEIARKNQAVISIPSRNKTDLDFEFIRCDGASLIERAVPEEGFFDREEGFVWSRERSTMTVSAETTIYLSCNYLGEAQERVVDISDGLTTEQIRITDRYVCHEIRFSGEFPKVIQFSADGFLNMKEANRSNDARDLSFQLHFYDPTPQFAVDATRSHRQCLLFVGNDKKEQDSLYPIYKRMLDNGHNVRLVDIDEAIHATRQDYSMVAGYVIAMGGTFVRLREAGCRGSFIYVEHGVSPVKRYTYGAHYLQYDLVLLPGRLWVDRLTRLYPRIKDRCQFIGYPKLHREESMSDVRRAEMCAELGLDPMRPIIIFAPTWSGGDARCGIFNITHFDASENMLAIPHDGDVAFCREFVAAGYRIHRPPHGKSISDYYPLADILVSDVSSTAIEFAFFGKPVVCLELTAIQDFDEAYLEGPTSLRIPHTNDYWDFCEWTSPENLTHTLSRLTGSGIDSTLLRRRLESAKEVVAYCGEEASTHAVNEITEFFKKKQFC